jgi:hypothetical protein
VSASVSGNVRTDVYADSDESFHLYAASPAGSLAPGTNSLSDIQGEGPNGWFGFILHNESLLDHFEEEVDDGDWRTTERRINYALGKLETEVHNYQSYDTGSGSEWTHSWTLFDGSEGSSQGGSSHSGGSGASMSFLGESYHESDQYDSWEQVQGGPLSSESSSTWTGPDGGSFSVHESFLSTRTPTTVVTVWGWDPWIGASAARCRRVSPGH